MKYLITYKIFEKKNNSKFILQQKPSEKELKTRWDKKRRAIKRLSKNISNLKRQITKDLSNSDEKIQLIATITKIIEMTGERVGNESSANNGHVGVSYFKNKNIKINGNNITLKYVGKSGVEHNNTIKNSRIASILKKLKNKNKNYLFVTSNGQKIRPYHINKYLSKFNITSKDLRGFKANKLMREKLANLPKTKDEKQIKKNFNETLRQVATIIQHTPQTLRNHYLLPEIEQTYYKYGSIGYVKKI